MKARRGDNASSTVVYLSTYPPRECGIATFTRDLVQAIDERFNPATKSKIIALDEGTTSFYNYGAKTLHHIPADNLEAYVAIAERINRLDAIRLVNIQHEFGLFGGRWGDYLIPFLQVIKKPVVVTFHSVLPRPEAHLVYLVRFIAERSRVIVVMNKFSKEILSTDYGVPRSKIALIPHGIPPTTLEPSAPHKTLLGLEGKTVLSTFGLLSPNKGIEYMIRALPPLVRLFPNLVYLVIGETHPVVRGHSGEEYRNFLHAEVKRLGMSEYVKFHNKYLSLDDIITYLKATDIYISPSLGEEQSVSGTLSYALGCGRPVVATQTSYAKYLINERNGALVEFKNPTALGRALRPLLADERRVKELGRGAYESTRKMIWPNVAAEYFHLFKKFVDITEERKLPSLKLDHLMRLTDNFGILHHAKYGVPQRRYGWSLDDNSRALIVAARCWERMPQEAIRKLLETYLNFMKFSQLKNGSFARLVNSHKELDRAPSDDVTGRAVWALGYFLSRDVPSSLMRARAEEMLKKALLRLELMKVDSPRAIAFAMIGLYHYLMRFQSPRFMELFLELAERELKLYRENMSEDWQWFEDRLTYSNSKLPEALYYAYALTHERRYLEVAERTLKFLSGITFEKKYYAPIGQAGWYVRNKARSYFDQQPEDTASMVETKIVAYNVTGNALHANDAYLAFQWFLGRNHLGQMVYDAVTGGCHDGLGQNALNLNEGAESTISYLLARLSIEEIQSELGAVKS